MVRISELEKKVCEKYNLKPRKISDTKILQLMELILANYGTLELNDLEVTQDGYGFYAQVPEDKKYLNDNYDEKPPVNAGYSNDLKDTILSLLCCEQIVDSLFLADDIQYLLMTKLEKIKEQLW